MQNPQATATEAWSEVRAAGRSVRYRRTGTGRPVLLIAPPGGAGDPWAGLAEALAAGHRVLVPELPSDCHALAPDLSLLLEGIGARDLSIVVVGMSAAAALEVVLRDADRIARLVVIADSDGPEDLEGTLASTVGAAPVPLLIARRATPAALAIPRILEFLAVASAPRRG